MQIENLLGQMVEVIVSKNGKMGSKTIKVCKVKARSILFIEVDRENRKNIFWKVARKNIKRIGEMNTGPFVLMVDGYLLSENKWESSWDSIGTKTISGNAYGYRSTTNSRAGFPMV